MFCKSKEKKQEEEEHQSSLKKTREIASKYLLTTSAEAYVSSVGKELSDFDLRGVDSALLGANTLGGTILECEGQMTEKAQGLGAEVVTDIKPTIHHHPCYDNPLYMMGTALIPKQKK